VQWRRQARLPPALEDREPVHSRQAQIEDDGVVALRARQEIRALAVAGDVHGVGRVLERRRQVCRQARFVFHHEQSHLVACTARKMNGT